METIYVIIENGDPYPCVYKTYDQAIAAVKAKHKEELEEELRWLEELEEELRWLEENPGDHGCNEVDVPEAASGPSYLYIEKGIHIYIHRLPVLK